MDLAVVAAAPNCDETAARALLDACYRTNVHVQGDLDHRIVAFYEAIRAVHPDSPPYDDATPWSSMPLGIGIDHVFMNIRWSTDHTVVALIQRLAAEHGLVLYDPQDDTVYLPPRES
jgi:hypothetical protein